VYLPAVRCPPTRLICDFYRYQNDEVHQDVYSRLHLMRERTGTIPHYPYRTWVSNRSSSIIRREEEIKKKERERDPGMTHEAWFLVAHLTSSSVTLHHSTGSLSCDRSTDSIKASSPEKYELVLPLAASCTFSLPSDHPAAAYAFFVFPSLPSIFPSTTCSRWQCLRNAWQIRLHFPRFTVCRMFFLPWLYATLLHL
jgi:hypothetical protein